ncbi:kinesin-domain-containing protein [Metschnikowia bicuspidata]|uniref:Kinesin-like protein n=1 Tax=Metschnikowia bicuspidata TaxID=27322 RepID=A0A4P9ZKY1_9ASCO|nr:kinesin-domain-containing protein [Metschnikowia bicuspidata]
METRGVFTYDSVFGEDASQEAIYEAVGQRTLEDFFKGFNGTILAYGQTGAGKSYTMMGTESEGSVSVGLIPRISENIFKHIAKSLDPVEFTVGLCMMEVYKEHVFDLLDPQQNSKDFTIHEDKVNGVYMRGISQAFVSSASEMASVLKQGSRNRRTSSTSMNTECSRSHAIKQIILTQKDVTSGEIRKSHLFLVDLAGSEKVDCLGATGDALQGTSRIDHSLSVLGLVINSLTDPKVNHIPYRDSKLTRILQESLGGNSRTTLIINISPASKSYSETLSTLRFGSRAKRIRNSVHINMELSASQLKGRILALERHNKELEEVLAEHYTPLKSPELVNHATFISSPSQTLAVKTKSSKSSFNSARHTLLTLSAGESLLIQEELRRKDEKINQLEQELLSLKMASLTTLHNEDLKLFKLECALYKLNDKLNNVELINTNLRRHLQLSEKTIKARGLKIEKLRKLVAEQQEQVNRESFHFESKLKVLKHKFDAQKFRESSRGQPEESFSEDSNTSFVHDEVIFPSSIQNVSRVASDGETPTCPKIGLNLRIIKPLRGGVKSSDS